MAWTKLFTAGSDVPVGFQSVNKLKANLEVHRDALAAEHAYGVTPKSGFLMPPWKLSPYKTLGRHNDRRIARAVCYVTFDANGRPYLQWTGGFFTTVSQFGVGSCFIATSGLTSFSGQAQPYNNAEGDPSTEATAGSWGVWATVRPQDTGSTPGIFVNTYRRIAGVDALTSGIEFSLAGFGAVD